MPTSTPLTPDSILAAIKTYLPILKPEGIPADFVATLRRLLAAPQSSIDKERLNILLQTWGLGPVTIGFFNKYFGNKIDSPEDFISGLMKFLTDALWYYGDAVRAFDDLRVFEHKRDFEIKLRPHEFKPEAMSARLDWNMIDNIEPYDRGKLGYVSGQRPFDDRKLITYADAVLRVIEEQRDDYSRMSREEVINEVIKRLSTQHGDVGKWIRELNKLDGLQEHDLFQATSLEKCRGALGEVKKRVDTLIAEVERLRETGRRNMAEYLRNASEIDVYVATSMRNDKEYLEMHDFIKTTFESPCLSELKIRYFDPTLCYCDSRLDKGIFECLLVRSAKVTIYCAQDNDTFGKDSELATTLCQGKPAIVYVPSGADRDVRAKTFKEFHPLGLQVGVLDGVARGVLVVRSPEECAEMLRRIITNTLETDVTCEEHGIVLRERMTRSILRVMTGWHQLRQVFWNNFTPCDVDVVY